MLREYGLTSINLVGAPRRELQKGFLELIVILERNEKLEQRQMSHKAIRKRTEPAHFAREVIKWEISKSVLFLCLFEVTRGKKDKIWKHDRSF